MFVIEVILLLEKHSPPPIAPRPTAKLCRQNPQKAIGDLRLELTSTLTELGFKFYLFSRSTI